MTKPLLCCIISQSATHRPTWSSIEVVITGTTGNRVYPKRVPRVQIPPAPPDKPNPHPNGWGFGLSGGNGGFEQSNANVRWTFAWRQLDGANSLFFATRKCNKSLLLRPIVPPIQMDGGLVYLAVMGGFEHLNANVRWTFAWRQLDGANSLISATRKCNKSLLLFPIMLPIRMDG